MGHTNVVALKITCLTIALGLVIVLATGVESYWCIVGVLCDGRWMCGVAVCGGWMPPPYLML